MNTEFSEIALLDLVVVTNEVDVGTEVCCQRKAKNDLLKFAVTENQNLDKRRFDGVINTLVNDVFSVHLNNSA
jgi:hypothetical protein